MAGSRYPMVTTAIVAWCTLLALAPLRRPLALGTISFLSGFVLNELPFVAFYYLLVSTWLAIGQGGLDSPSDWAAAGLAVLAAAGLVVVAWRGLRTGPAVNRALSEGLGAGWRTALDAGMAARLRRLPLARILFGPFFFRRRDVERVANISYGNAGRKNLLDLYRHRSHPPVGPILVHLHGGALFMGKKNREALPLLYRLASQGWVCVSANYRLRPAAKFPDHLIDVKKVIAWVREHGYEYGADPAVVFVAGSSSGGQPTGAGGPHSQRPRLPARFRARGPLGQRCHLPARLLRLPRHQGPVTLITPGLRRNGCAAVLRGTRRPRQSAARSDGPPVRRGAAGHLIQSGHLRGAARRTARVRPVPFPPLRHGRRGDRGLHRLGEITRDGPITR